MSSKIWPDRAITVASATHPAATTETETLPAPAPDLEDAVEADAHLDRPWNVVLLDDDHHTYEYVIEMLHILFGHSIRKAFGMAVEVDNTGRVIVWTGHREIAEAKREQIHEYGADWRMDTSRGSMSAILEPAR